MKYMINVRVCVREISVTVDVIISSFCCVGLFLFSLFIYFFFMYVSVGICCCLCC